ncbi:MAG: hypothetical protein WA968_05500 [Castellaniella sp.]
MKKALIATILCMGGLLATAPAAQADVDIGVSIGIPGVIWGSPDYYYPPRPYYHRPRVVVVPEPVYVPGPVYRMGWADRGHYDRHERRHWKKNWKHNRGHRGRGWDD